MLHSISARQRLKDLACELRLCKSKSYFSSQIFGHQISAIKLMARGPCPASNNGTRYPEGPEYAMGEPPKGTVTSLSSIYSPEDAQKASVRVQETISERQKEVQQLQTFLNDNTNLVPFGKAAFFPGKIIHTNEFLVLLGEGYYADRTSKQTIEILKRRGKDLESQIENLNAVIKDLKYEASFFIETATEAAEGVVEIREDYVDEFLDEEKEAPTEEEYSRIDELEKEEMESEMAEEDEEKEEEEEEEKDKAELSDVLSRTHLEPKVISSEKHMGNEHLKSKESSNIKAPTSSATSNTLSRPIEQKKSEILPQRIVSKNEVSNSGSNMRNDSSQAFTGSIVERTHNTEKSQTSEPIAPPSKPVSRFKMQRKPCPASNNGTRYPEGPEYAMGEPPKGTVTSLSSIYSPEDAQKASVRVQETISERQKEVQQLQTFLNDNTNLVPFGKAAFFPGKIIHTNEFLVLLGECYYADRTSKQTIEILKRRGNDLESQIENLNAVIKDLKYEASFFIETATEAAEGVVEIREDYVDEFLDEEKEAPTEEEYSRILSRIDELEKEEMESEMAEEDEEKEEEEEEEKDKAELSDVLSRTHLEPKVISSEKHMGNEHLKSKESSNIKAPTSSATSNTLSRPIEQKKSEILPQRIVSKNEVSNSGSNMRNDSSQAFTGSIVERTHNTEKSQTSEPIAPPSKPVSRFKMQRK
ncbi:hypothetical protein LXL04_017005 [Taraxacum kok-saghyz]